MTGGVKIMIAESDQKTASSLATALRKEGWEVVLSGDVIHALSVALKQKPAAVILGTQLPGGGGLSVLKRMRASVHTAGTPVIAVTGSVGPKKQEFLSAGAQECMDQPVETGALCAAIRKHLAQPPVITGAPVDLLRAPERMAALEKTELLDTAPSEPLDMVTRITAKLLGVPAALVSLVDKDRQFFKSQFGLPDPLAVSRQTPLSHSFCQWVVSGREQVVVRDAREDPVLRNNLAVRDLGVIAYAGVPLSAGVDQVIGSFCAIDLNPHTWSEEDIATLRDLAQVTEAYIAFGQARHGSAGSAPAGIRRNTDALADVRVAASGIGGAARTLQRRWRHLNEPEREALFGIVETQSQYLVHLTGGQR